MTNSSQHLPSHDDQIAAPTVQPPPNGLLAALRDPRYYPAIKAIFRKEVSRFNMPGALYFTYSIDGDEVILMDEERREIERVLAAAAGQKTLKLQERVLPGRSGETTLCLMPKAEEAITMELLMMLANLQPSDLQGLPPPVELQ